MAWQRYNALLARRPFLTRSCVAATMMSSGDIIAQRVFERNEKHDVPRSARFAFYGFVFHAPVLAQWFKLVDKLQFKSKVASLTTKVILDQTLWGPWSCTMFFSMMGLMEGMTVHEVVEKVQVAFLPTYIAGATVFLPTSLLTYSVIPAAHRGLFLQAVGLGWNTYLSASNNRANDKVAVLEEAMGHVPTVPDSHHHLPIPLPDHHIHLDRLPIDTRRIPSSS